LSYFSTGVFFVHLILFISVRIDFIDILLYKLYKNKYFYVNKLKFLYFFIQLVFI